MRGQTLAGKGLDTVSDLLYYAPFRYEDRRNVKAISELAPGEKAVVLARVSEAKLSGFHRRALGLFEATFHDGSGANLLARWFHGERYADTLVPGTRVALFGKIELDRTRGSRLIVQPEIEILSEDEDNDEMLHSGRVVPVYEAAGKISTRVFRKLIHRLLKEIPMPDDALPENIRQKHSLPNLETALREIHSPAADADVRLLNEFRSPAQTRLIFEEFFWLECGLLLKKSKARLADGISFTINGGIREKIKKMLPFKPTAAQRRVIQEIADDMKRPHPMNRLLQGDVGSGKTIVAARGSGDRYREWISGGRACTHRDPRHPALRLFQTSARNPGLCSRPSHRFRLGARKAADQKAPGRGSGPYDRRHARAAYRKMSFSRSWVWRL